MTSFTPILAIVEGKPVASSVTVAEHFEKKHKHVLDAIQRIINEVPLDFNEPNFRPVDYLDAKGERRPAYELSRDGFTLLAMGFTGKKALAWKLKYIEAFNAMEAALRGKGFGKVDSEEARHAARQVFDFINAACRLGGAS